MNRVVTMVLGGLWHGAAWTFAAWGALHVAYLGVKHGWSHYGPTVAPRFARAAGIAASMLTRAQWARVQGLRRSRRRGHTVVCGAGSIGGEMIER